jgi:hypothetical protein
MLEVNMTDRYLTIGELAKSTGVEPPWISRSVLI